MKIKLIRFKTLHIFNKHKIDFDCFYIKFQIYFLSLKNLYDYDFREEESILIQNLSLCIYIVQCTYIKLAFKHCFPAIKKALQ